jgi:tetraacyldisaccharide 4'-kinase
MSVRRPWLMPFGVLFGGAAAFRAALYERGILPRARLRGPVISVGNLRVGGTGKTPLVVRCAEILRDAGMPVSVLSRGYRGAFRGECLVVGDGASVLATSIEAGDEPVMLARSLPGVVVAVGRRRDRVGQAVEKRFGPRVHLLDDGFQHLRLFRDLNLLCIASGDLGEWPLPAGDLREFPSARRRADLVFAPGDEAGGLLERERTFRLGRRVVGFFTLDGAPRPAPARPFLLSGIARPERFLSDARGEVPELAGTAVFPDHHPFTVEELRRVLEDAHSAGADALVTTAKDAVRLPAVEDAMPVLVLAIAAAIEDEARFKERLLSVARRAA